MIRSGNATCFALFLVLLAPLAGSALLAQNDGADEGFLRTQGSNQAACCDNTGSGKTGGESGGNGNRVIDDGEHRYLSGRVIVRLTPAGFEFGSPLTIPVLLDALADVPELRAKRMFPETPASRRRRRENPPSVDLRPIFALDFAPSYDVKAVLRKLRPYRQWVAYAEPYYVQTPLGGFTPDDMDSVTNYAVVNTQAEKAWDINQGDENVILAIIDTGTEWFHPDLIDNIAINENEPIDGVDNDLDGFVDNRHGWDFAGHNAGLNDQDNDPAPDTNLTRQQINSHGTQVTGLAGATTNNGFGTVGMGFNVSMMPIKTTPDTGCNCIIGGYDAIKYAADRGADVINASWGGGANSQFQREIIRFATFDRDALVVAAGGNNGSPNASVPFPAAYPEVLAVAAAFKTDELVGTGGREIDLSAPGGGRTTNSKGRYFNFMSKGLTFTSFSSPVAAGAAGVVRSEFPSLSAQQTGELLRVTTDNTYNLPANQGKEGLYGSGRLNLFRALTVSSPAIRNESIDYTDNVNDLLESGDTLSLWGDFRNFLAATSNLRIRLEVVNSNNITILDGQTNAGAVGQNAVVNTGSDPFRFVIDPSTPSNEVVEFRLVYEDGLYQDEEFFELTLNPTFTTLDNGLLATSFTSDGNFGYNDYPVNQQGVGLLFGGESFLFEGGFMVGRSPAQLADNVRTEPSPAVNQSQDFVGLERATTLPLTSASGEMTRFRFDDRGLGANAMDVEVQGEVLAFQEQDKQSFFIMNYALTNQSFQFLDSLHVGVLADFDLPLTGSGDDSTRLDTARQMLYTFGNNNAGENTHLGLMLLDSTLNFHARALTPFGTDFNDSTKFAAISGGTSQATASRAEVLSIAGAGPFSLIPQQTDTITFLLVAGTDLADLQANADRARQAFDCFFKSNSLPVSIQGPNLACGQATLDATTPGAVSYEWANGTTGPQLSLQGPKAQTTRRVTAFNADGCAFSAEHTLEIAPDLDADFGLSDTLLSLPNATLQFADSTPAANSHTWFFGDGFGFMGPSGSHTYLSPGTYTVQLIAANNACEDTASRQVVVQQATGRAPRADAGLSAAPNPFGRRLRLQLPPTEQPIQLRLTDAMGREVHSTELPAGTPRHELVPGKLPAGVYLLRARSGERSWRLKLVHEQP